MSRFIPWTFAALLIFLVGCGGQEQVSSDKTKKRPTPQQGPASAEAPTPQEIHEAAPAPTPATSPAHPDRARSLTISGQARDRITAINPSKIHIDSDGRVVTKDLSYEEMGKLAEVLAEADESGELQSSREYEVTMDNRC